MAQISSNKCNTCGKDNAELFCYECQFYLCEPCGTLHAKFLKKHTVTKSNRIDKSVFALKLKCGGHDLEYAHFCTDCKCLTCSECTTSDHKGHEFTDVSEIVAIIRKDFNQANCKVKEKLKSLLALIDKIENVKMKKVEDENKKFVKESRKIANELIQFIELVAEQNDNHASDFLTNEQQIMDFELAKLKKLQKDYKSIIDKIEQLIEIEHDMTFYVQQKSLNRYLLEIESIPNETDPDKIGEFAIEDFIDKIIGGIQSKYDIRCWKKKDKEIEKLQKEIDEERSNASENKARNDAEMQNIRQEMNKQSAALQIEKNQIKKLEDEKANLQEVLKTKDDKIKTLQTEIDEKTTNILEIKTCNEAKMQKIRHQLLNEQNRKENEISDLLKSEKSKIKELEDEIQNVQRFLKTKDDKIETLQTEIDKKTINITEIKVCYEAEMQKLRQKELNEKKRKENEISDLLEIEKSKIKELEDDKKHLQRCLKMKEDEIERLQKVIDDDRIHITEIKTRNGAVSQEMNKQNALLQIEKNKIKELEDDKKITQRCSMAKDAEIEKLKKEINETKSNIAKIQASNDANLQNIHQNRYLLHSEKRKIYELERGKTQMERMQQKTEEDLANLRKDRDDAKNIIKSLTDQHDGGIIKTKEEIDRLKFQVEYMMKQQPIVHRINSIGLSECRKSFKSLIMLVAIEIGTLFSGCCYSFKGWNKDSEKQGFLSPQLYTEEKLQMKIPTSLLVNSEEEFECFGVDAENHYRQKGESDNWFYFTNFKTMLARSKDKKFEIQMRTQDGSKEMPAVFIYSLAIKYFKDVVTRSLERGNLRKDDVGWILTFPTSATAELQQIMLQAAIKAGISERKLMVVSETDATVAVCRSESVNPSIQCGSKVLILDLGSGSFDISVCDVKEDQSLNTQLSASFPAVGWLQVLKVLEQILEDIVGKRVFQQYCKEYTKERKQWLDDIFRKICFESEAPKEYMYLKLPMDLKNVLYKETGKQFAELICQSKFSDTLTCIANDKIKFSVPDWHKLFDLPVQQIKYYVNQVTEMEGMESLTHIIITGGIIQSETIQLRIKQLFLDKNIIIPKDVGFAVLRGAITIGMS